MESIQDQLAKLMNPRRLNQKYQEILKEKVFKDPDVKAFLEANRKNLDTEAVLKSASKLYEFVQEKKRFKADQTAGAESVVRGHYPKLVLHNKRILVEYVPSQEELDRQKKQASQNRLKTYYIDKEVQEANFDDLFYNQDKVKAIEKVIDFLEAYKADPKDFHQGLYLYGSFGVGKTYLLGAMAKTLTELGFEVSMVYFPSFTSDMKSAIGDNTVNDKLDAIQNTEILIIDDIGAESMSAWLRDDILGVILQYRMQHNLSTFFTSNISMKQLEEEHLAQVRGGSEPVKAARLMERVRYLAEEVEMTGTNQRHKSINKN
ncbi:Primosomal protein DnaI [Alloiococcus otitis]|mgnify:CR=1 FL=1|uniref:Primosomal protein DnaI n=1 Tax=Alloiococcus otitis ATCC 51267 TaxID=883081 RepID=K9EF31_9LACT|nr:primosomal protein DnaI [Alloiococcus otitis]EKU94461.1 hypothetical protein HMPREF9698_00051 [Alloiococcus otitis ATCC 51267]SUU81347.1 Primosomal protein DnaI [Alloiococcus otitis]